MNPLVVNVRYAKCQVYVGRRKQGMHFGNPWSHLPLANCIPAESRAVAIANYKAWLDGSDFKNVEQERRNWIIENLPNLRGKTLGCFCWPLACHAEILVGAALTKPSPVIELEPDAITTTSPTPPPSVP